MVENQIRADPHQRRQSKDGPALYDGGTIIHKLKIDEEAQAAEKVPCPAYWPMTSCRVTCPACGVTD